MPVTMKMIAHQSGVSRPAVSMILNGKADHLRADTRKRVLAVARQLGYRPNGAALAIKHGRFGSIALLLSTQPFRSELPAGLLAGIDEELHARDLSLTLARLPDERLTDPNFVPRILREYVCDGLLINYFDKIPPEMEQLIEASKLPKIWINRQCDHDCVFPDDIGAGRDATQRLLAMGHHRIAFTMQSNSTHYSVAHRYEGYCQAMRHAGHDPFPMLAQDGGIPLGQRVAAARQWLDTPDRPTAVVVYGNQEAMNFVTAATSLGLSLGRDLSMVTFSEHQTLLADLWLDTQLIPENKIGHQAVQLLEQRIAQGNQPLDAIAIPFEFIAGQSCHSPHH